MEIGRFPFKKIGKEYLGIIQRPYAIVFIQSKHKEWYPIEMLVDTGADYTLLPRKYAYILGIDLTTECVAKTTLGIGGSETVYLHKSLPIKLGDWLRKIPVGFLERDDVPPLLGRLEFIEILKVIFENYTTTFERI